VFSFWYVRAFTYGFWLFNKFKLLKSCLALGLCGLLDALGRVFRVFLLLNYGFLEVIFLFLFMHVVASLPHLLFLCFFFHFCHFGSGFFLLTSSFCEPYQLTEGYGLWGITVWIQLLFFLGCCGLQLTSIFLGSHNPFVFGSWDWLVHQLSWIYLFDFLAMEACFGVDESWCVWLFNLILWFVTWVSRQ